MTKVISLKSYISELNLTDYKLYNLKPFTDLVLITTLMDPSVKYVYRCELKY